MFVCLSKIKILTKLTQFTICLFTYSTNNRTMPSYIVDRAQAKEAYLRGLATRAGAGVASTTTPTTSTSTAPQAVVPWVPTISTTARPLLEQPRQHDAVVSSLFFKIVF